MVLNNNAFEVERPGDHSMTASVAILGGPNSGKTTLLAALSHAYRERTSAGFLLEARNKEAGMELPKLWRRLRDDRQFPWATFTGSLVEWDFHHMESRTRLNVMDFPGEVYARTFSDGDFTKEDARALAGHARRSSCALALVDLEDLIDGPDCVWHHKAALDFMRNNSCSAGIAIVLTKIDRYQHVLDQCSGNWNDVIKRHLPGLLSAHPDVKVLGVSAVNRVVADKNGREIPDMDFGSEGLDEVMRWIASFIDDAADTGFRFSTSRPC